MLTLLRPCWQLEQIPPGGLEGKLRTVAPGRYMVIMTLLLCATGANMAAGMLWVIDGASTGRCSCVRSTRGQAGDLAQGIVCFA